MSDLRSKFEEISEIKETLQCGIYYNADLNSYSSVTGASYISLARINGAWFAFQERQKKIDSVIKWVEDKKKSIPLSEWHGYTTEEYVDADDLLELLND